MYVRMQIGRHLGKIRDIEPEAARAMLADGRASAVDFSTMERPLKVKAVGSAAVVAAVAVTTAGNKNKKNKKGTA